MRATALRPKRFIQPIDVAWGMFAVVNATAMVRWERWETVPFHFIWVSLTLVYGLRVWRRAATTGVLAAVAVVTGTLILIDIHGGTQEWSELTEVPLMTAMFVAMVWHAQRRQVALVAVEQLADERASLLERQERFLHDASHELRTPVTVARGHLEVLATAGGPTPEVQVALDELERMERLIGGLLLLAKGDQPDFIVPCDIDVESFVEDVFMRWSEVAQRAWRLGPVAGGALRADSEALRTALDALLDNAVKHTDPSAAIELRARAVGGSLEIEVADTGAGIPEDAVEKIFERFSRADAARGRDGGVGLGLAIVDAIAKAHDGRCMVRTSPAGTTFCLVLPGFVRARVGAPPRVEAVTY
jgi:signal transduction histidine kinase